MATVKVDLPKWTEVQGGAHFGPDPNTDTGYTRNRRLPILGYAGIYLTPLLVEEIPRMPCCHEYRTCTGIFPGEPPGYGYTFRVM